jgi:hypothetical protein
MAMATARTSYPATSPAIPNAVGQALAASANGEPVVGNVASVQPGMPGTSATSAGRSRLRGYPSKDGAGSGITPA